MASQGSAAVNGRPKSFSTNISFEGNLIYFTGWRSLLKRRMINKLLKNMAVTKMIVTIDLYRKALKKRLLKTNNKTLFVGRNGHS